MNHTRIQDALEALLKPRGFVALDPRAPDPDTMGGWCAEYLTDEFRVIASQDRTGDVVSICVGSRIRRKPAAQMRGPWSLSHLRGHLDGSLVHYIFGCVEDQIDWFHDNVTEILQTPLLNSDHLNQWSVDASRRLFGQPVRKRKA